MDEGKPGFIDGHQKVRCAGRLDEAKHARCVPPIEVWPSALSYWLDRKPALVRAVVLAAFGALLLLCIFL